MEDFIKSVVSQLGVDEGVAKNATGTALGFLKSSLGDQFSTVLEKLPGADQLMQQSSAAAASESGGGGGLLGSITGAASKMFGGGGGESLELMGALQKTGLSAKQGGSFFTMLIDFIKDKVGENVFNQIADKIPMVKNFV